MHDLIYVCTKVKVRICADKMIHQTATKGPLRRLKAAASKK